MVLDYEVKEEVLQNEIRQEKDDLIYDLIDNK